MQSGLRQLTIGQGPINRTHREHDRPGKMPAKAWGKMRIASKFAGAGAKAPAPGGAEQVATLVTALNSQWEAKKAVQMVTALEALAKLDPAELTKHAGAVHQVAQTPGTYRGQMMAHVALHHNDLTNSSSTRA